MISGATSVPFTIHGILFRFDIAYGKSKIPINIPWYWNWHRTVVLFSAVFDKASHICLSAVSASKYTSHVLHPPTSSDFM